MGKHSKLANPMPSSASSLHPVQFGNVTRSAPQTPFGNAIKSDMARRQGGFQLGTYTGKHAAAYSPEADIATSMDKNRKPYTARHDMLNQHQMPAPGKIDRTQIAGMAQKSAARKELGIKIAKGALKIATKRSKAAGRNAAILHSFEK